MEEEASDRTALITVDKKKHLHNSHGQNGVKMYTTEFHLNIFGNNKEDNDENIRKSLKDSEKITFTWSEINVFALENSTTKSKLFSRNRPAPKSTHILKNVNGVAYPGELLAILGTHNSGKDLLLSTLTYRSPSYFVTSGLICANGLPVNIRVLTNQLVYVQKGDLFIQSLTVKEHLLFQALLRIDHRISYEEIKSLVEQILFEFNLKEIENVTIRTQGILNGEMRRLSLASEFLTNPSLIFCDEPTSGLDAFMALNVGQMLKRVAQSGKTVVCTINQPSSELYALFDKIMIMSEGRIAFYGTPDEANIFFQRLESPCPSNYNPADYFIQLLTVLPGQEKSCKHAIGMICDAFERSEMGVHLAVQAATLIEATNDYNDLNSRKRWNYYRSPWFNQFKAVLWRTCLSVIKEPLLIKDRLLQTIMFALIIGIIFYGQHLDQDGVVNINGAIYLFICILTFENVFGVIQDFFAELPILLKETKNKLYRADVYFLSKFLAELLIYSVFPTILVCICYFLVGLNSNPPRFFVAVGMAILISNAAASFGYFVSNMTNNVSMAKSVSYPLLLLFILLGGYFLSLGSAFTYLDWLSYISWFRYGNEALLLNQWNDITYINCTLSKDMNCLLNGNEVLESFDFADGKILTDVLALFGLIFGYRILAFLLFLIMTYRVE